MSDYQEGEILVNPQTGERVQLVSGQWKPVLADLKDRIQSSTQSLPPVPRPTGNDFARGLSLGVRDIISGAMGLPLMAADVATMPLTALKNVAKAGYNRVMGNEPEPGTPLIGGGQQVLQAGLDAAGFPQPQNDSERMMSAVTRGVSGAATGLGIGGAMGGASLGASQLAQALAAAPRTQLAIGAVSPAAGEMVRQSGGGPVAQTAAELGTALAIGGPAAMSRTGGPPSIDQLRSASNAAYKAAEQAGAVFKPSAYDNFFAALVPDIRKAGFDVNLHPKVSAVLTRLEAEQGKPQTLENLEILRRVTKSAAASPEADERRIAGMVQDKLDNFVANAGPADIMAGNAAVAVPALQQARKLWSQASKADTIETLMDRAKLSAPNFSGSGMENAVRTEFRALAKNERKMRLFTDAEQDAIRKVAMGGPTENALRMLGKFAPTGVVSGALSSGTGALFGGGIGAVALPTAGFAARQGATALTMRNARLAEELMRGGQMSRMGIDPNKLAAALAAMNNAGAGQ